MRMPVVSVTISLSGDVLTIVSGYGNTLVVNEE